jgi:hypothetical protein
MFESWFYMRFFNLWGCWRSEKIDNESYRHGFEAALELCIAETTEAETKEKALAKMTEFLGLVKGDKMERLREMLWKVQS